MTNFSIMLFTLVMSAGLLMGPSKIAFISAGAAISDNAEYLSVIGENIVNKSADLIKRELMKQKAAEYAEASYTAAELAELVSMDSIYIEGLYAMYLLDSGYEPGSRSLQELLTAAKNMASDKVLSTYLDANAQNALSQIEGIDLGMFASMELDYKTLSTLTNMDEKIIKLLFIYLDEKEKPSSIKLSDIAKYLLEHEAELQKKFGVSIESEDIRTMLELVVEG